MVGGTELNRIGSILMGLFLFSFGRGKRIGGRKKS
jgi:hypothetical protein